MCALAAAFWLSRDGGAGRASRPIALLTALPMVWGEGDVAAILGKRADPSLSYRWLAGRYDVTPLDAVDAAALSPHRLMLVAQPRALAPAELVAIDDWVRRGGHVLIFSDPWLGRPSSLAIGDPRRAPVLSLLDPLLAHWGLALQPPRPDEAGLIERSVAGNAFRTIAPGSFRATGNACRIEEGGLVAFCAIGAGQALIVADADLLADAHWAESRNDRIVGQWLSRIESDRR